MTVGRYSASVVASLPTKRPQKTRRTYTHLPPSTRLWTGATRQDAHSGSMLRSMKAPKSGTTLERFGAPCRTLLSAALRMRACCRVVLEYNARQTHTSTNQCHTTQLSAAKRNCMHTPLRQARKMRAAVQL